MAGEPGDEEQALVLTLPPPQESSPLHPLPCLSGRPSLVQWRVWVCLGLPLRPEAA